MTRYEWPVLVTVLVLFVALYSAAGGLLLFWVRERLARRTPSRRMVWLRRLALGLAGFGVLCLLYAWQVEPYWLQVRHVRIPSAKRTPRARPIRIVQISDTHCEAMPRLEERLPAVIAAERPDVIVFTGDALNAAAGLPVFRRLMTRLAAIAPTFAVQGNWDANYWRRLGLFHGTGVRELDGETARLTLDATPVWIGGASVWDRYWAHYLFRAAPPNAVTVFLYHMPGGILDARGQADLCLVGHTHGGQVALPFYGALVTLSELGKRYEAGLYRVDSTWLYVNRGLGLEGGGAPRLRFLARPEVTVIELVPSD